MELRFLYMRETKKINCMFLYTFDVFLWKALIVSAKVIDPIWLFCDMRNNVYEDISPHDIAAYHWSAQCHEGKTGTDLIIALFFLLRPIVPRNVKTYWVFRTCSAEWSAASISPHAWQHIVKFSILYVIDAAHWAPQMKYIYICLIFVRCNLFQFLHFCVEAAYWAAICWRCTCIEIIYLWLVSGWVARRSIGPPEFEDTNMIYIWLV